MLTARITKARPILSDRAGVMGALALVIVAMGLVAFARTLPDHIYPWWGDLDILTAASQRALTGERWYAAHQLSGPYPLTFGTVLYPPVAAFAFAPWVVLPQWSFVVIPVVGTAWLVYRWRPTPWSWPVMAFAAVWPTSILYVIYANPSLWMMLFVGLGLRYRWPAALILLKPSLLPFALVGIRSRSWWLGAGVMILACLPLLPQWLAYATVVQNAETSLAYSLGSVPAMLVPVVAYFASAPPRTSWPRGLP